MTNEQVERFERIIKTPLGSRVMLPSFGSKLHELIDKTINEGWILQLRRYLFEAFFNDANELWDRDFNPKLIRAEKADDITEVNIYMLFENGLELNYVI